MSQNDVAACIPEPWYHWYRFPVLPRLRTRKANEHIEKGDPMKVECATRKGMFRNELSVSFNTGYENVKSIVPKGEVVNGRIDLDVESETDEDYIVFVPGEVTSGKRYVRIKKSLLEV